MAVIHHLYSEYLDGGSGVVRTTCHAGHLVFGRRGTVLSDRSVGCSKASNTSIDPRISFRGDSGAPGPDPPLPPPASWGFCLLRAHARRADALCLGALSAIGVRSRRGWKLLWTQRKFLYILTAVLFAGVVYMTIKGWGQFSWSMTTGGYSWLALFYACCLLIVVSGRVEVLQKALHSWTLMRLGTVAYCVYLVHMPAIQVGRRGLESLLPRLPKTSWVLGGALGVLFTLVIAAGSWQLFEKPLVRKGHSYVY
jgi:peptidoglycan/LPS O-acetylase OafA/YrhL